MLLACILLVFGCLRASSGFGQQNEFDYPSQNYYQPQTSGFNTGIINESFSTADARKKMEWYQYLQRVFWRAGHYRGLSLLEQATNNLQVLPPDRPALHKLQAKIDSRKRMAGMLMRNPGFSNRPAYEATKMLIEQSYPQATAYLKSRTAPNFDHRRAPDDLNAIILTFGIINFDRLYDRPKIPLWEYFWKLRLIEKIEVLKYASELRETKNLMSLPKIPAYRHAVRARLMLIMKLQDLESILRTPEISRDWVESKMLRGYAAVTRGDYCGAIANFREALKRASAAASADINTHIAGWEAKCNRRESSRTFDAFCQAGAGTEFPISEAARHEPNARAILDNELMAWTAMRAGDCNVAMQALTELKQLVSQAFLTSHPIVSGRITYMEQNLTQCQQRDRNTFESSVGRQVLQALRTRQSHEAIRLARGSGDRSLLMAALLHRFPRAIYSPCMGGSVVGDNDLKTLELVEQISRGQVLPICMNGDQQCIFNQLRAFYISGSYADVKRLARQLPRSTTFCRPVVQMLGCLELCTAGTDKRKLNKAVRHFKQLLESGQSSPAVNVGKQLAEAKLRPTVNLQPIDFVDQQLGKTGRPPVADVLENLRNEIPLPSIVASQLPMGSCPQKGGCNRCSAPAPCPCQACAQPVVVPGPAQQAFAPAAQVAPAVAAQAAPQKPLGSAPSAPTNSTGGCGCSGSTDGIPVNKETGKIWTPEELQKKIDDVEKKRIDDALPLLEPLLQQKLASVCDKQKQTLNKAFEDFKDALQLDECKEAQRKAAEAEATALALGTNPIGSDAKKKKDKTLKPADKKKQPTK